MSEKSHVSMEQHVCIVCGKTYETGALLLDKRLRPTLQRNTTTGYGMCEEHAKIRDDGFITLIECDESKSELTKVGTQTTLKPWDAHRTGRLCHIKAEVLKDLLNDDTPLPPNGVCFVNVEMIEKLTSFIEPEEEGK